MPDATPQAFALPFKEAIEHLRQKLGRHLPSRGWTDTYGRVNAVGFAVAGAWKDALLTDLGDAVLKAMQDGTPVAEFQQTFEAIAARHQWAYKGKPAWRAAIILNTNLRSAYAAGKWQQIQQVKATRPYLRYVAVLDNRTRRMHREWHGRILPVQADWWKTHYPPNGWNCRCTVMSVSDRDLRRHDWKVTANDLDPDGNVLVVTGASSDDDDVKVQVMPDRRRIKVTPPVGFDAERHAPLVVRYTVAGGSRSADGFLVVSRYPSDRATA